MNSTELSTISNHTDLSSNVSRTVDSANDTVYGRNEALAVVEVAISATILLLAVLGNGVVLTLLALKKGRLSRMHLMMLHLSLADLSVALFQTLPQMVWDITFTFQGGAFLCGAVTYLQLVAMYASAYVLLSTAVDRYVAICRPFLSHNWTSRHAHLLVLAAWLAALLFSLPQVFIFSLKEKGEGTGMYDCWATFHPPWTLKLYVTWNVVSVFIVPSVLLTVLYGHISRAVWNTSAVEQRLLPRYLPQNSVIQTDGKAETLVKIVEAGKEKQSSLQSTVVTATSPVFCAEGPEWTTYKSGSFQPKGDSPTVDSHSDLFPQATQEKREDFNLKRDVQIFNGNSTTSPKSTDGPLHNHASSPLQPAVSDFVFNEQIPCRNDAGATAPHQWSADDTGRIPCQVSADGGRAGKVGQGISRAKMKTIKMTLTVVICYLLCWTPFYVAMLWSAYDEHVDYENPFFTLVLLLASVNSCTNPWIYMVFSETVWSSLRARVLALAACCRLTSVASHSSTSTHSVNHSTYHSTCQSV